ncbi:hypothetical protein BIV57_14700 [Mangrovactinospora gilvigrisea]|uniref:Uncharacterized protein n=1 Tax=Mangrovactinospora gilvigrisea TaxID=1428644 RepID=A0A1J7BTC0_9ACTN|nr:hypothetical protein BIV57_14700 [Mangrovactinospora gilvigrisea]
MGLRSGADAGGGTRAGTRFHSVVVAGGGGAGCRDAETRGIFLPGTERGMLHQLPVDSRALDRVIPSR